MIQNEILHMTLVRWIGCFDLASMLVVHDGPHSYPSPVDSAPTVLICLSASFKETSTKHGQVKRWAGSNKHAAVSLVPMGPLVPWFS